ncbi:MAG: deoxyribonuclease IV, partial [Chloroflexi bacterium]|nr:deoxyribonuclease IV [Chloroflexota bacterium]
MEVQLDLGAHVSAAGGVDRAVGRATAIGAEAIQLFASSPRGWKFKPIPDEKAESYCKQAAAEGIRSTFLHGSYLVNIGGKPDLVEKSIDSLINHMNAAAQIGARGVIFHSGSHKGVGFDAIFEQAIGVLYTVLDNTDDGVQLIIENCAGLNAQIGASFDEIGRMIKAVDSPRLTVCLDTEHAFAAGYNLAEPDGIEKTMEEFDTEIGLERLVVVHANDSKVELGSGIDRHENIGEGFIGIEGFEAIMAHPAFADVPFLLEVPGENRKGPDRPNLDRLKDIRARLAAAAQR